MRIRCEITGSPVGDLFLAESREEPVAILFAKGRASGAISTWLEKAHPEATISEGRCVETRRRLTEYFSRKGRTYPFPKILKGTPFELAVWKEIAKIPFGATETYGEIARRLGRPKGSRAVGGATGRNPVAILIPCHRVVGSHGNLTGYGGGIPTKIWLLRHEGILMRLDSGAVPSAQ